MDSYDLFVTAPRGTEAVLATELHALGVAGAAPGVGGVALHGPLELACRICLWSRVGNRVLLSLGRFPAPSPEALYAGVQAIDWRDHLRVEGTLAVDCFVRSSRITHSHYAALKVKDAVVDQFRARDGRRPSVDTARPDLRLNLYLYRDQARLALDLSGDSLHRRGYREEGGPAPLKENLAAAILLLADWPALAAAGAPLLDPLCGSGTLPIEAALLAADVAPGSLGRRFGFETWPGHQPERWRDLLAEAAERRAAGLARAVPVLGSDRDPRALAVAARNLARAGLTGQVRLEQRELARVRPPPGSAGLLVANPPYGERLGAAEGLDSLYRELGRLLRDRCQGWRAALFTGNPPLARVLGLDPEQGAELHNGPLPCRLFLYRVVPERQRGARGRGAAELTDGARAGPPVPLPPEGPGARMLVNRLQKNLRHLGRWARRQGVTCYRLYDADLPEYAVAVDLYEADGLWAVVQEYAPPPEVEPALVQQRLGEALGAVATVLELPPTRLVLRTRRRQRGSDQYQPLARSGALHEVREGSCRLLVNFTDYLDTGLFLDHRLTRALVGELAAGREFLNLFAYTGAATVHAALGGATATTSVDLSRTYLDWAGRNLALNGMSGPAHRLLQADCLVWLEQAAGESGERGRYGLIFLDPPTFSSSKRMEGVLDVQRDHVRLIRQTLTLLAPGGVLLFSTNYRRFRLDQAALAALQVQDLSAVTLPEDFRRNPRVHGCWRIRRPDPGGGV
jgi:23S rRNA (guanine2445-N2)-methyltransferase / 23S rRNA (guanine2069-N7)-methyltransferase